MSKITTYSDLKKITEGFVCCKVKGNMPEDYVITYRDLSSNSVYQLFSDSNSISSIIIGLRIENASSYKEDDGVRLEDIEVIYPIIDSISLTSGSYAISPCGGDYSVTCTADYSMVVRKISENDGSVVETVADKRKCEVAPSLKCDYSGCSVSGNVISISHNDTGKDIKFDFLCRYMYRKKQCSINVEAIQEANKYSEWKYSKDVTDSLSMVGSLEMFDKSGGTDIISVYRNYTRHYVKTDSCGNVVMEKEESGLTTDISKLASIKISDEKNFHRNVNEITADPQEIGAEKRTVSVTASFDGKKIVESITQDGGGVVTYEQILVFEENWEKEMRYVLSTSRNCVIKIPIVSKKVKKIDGTISEVKDNYEEIVIGEDSLFSSNRISYENGKTYIWVRIKKNNNGSKSEKFSIDAKNGESVITLNVEQPSPLVVSSKVTADIYSEKWDYTNETIGECKIYVVPYIIYTYDDGKTEKAKFLDKENKVSCCWNSDNSKYLSGTIVTKTENEGVYVMKPIWKKNDTINDISMCVKGVVKDSNCAIIGESEIKCVSLKGIDITTYKYDFSFSDGSSYNEMVWPERNMESFKIPIISKKTTYVNGVKTKEENENFEIRNLTDNTDMFSISTDNLSYLEITPKYENNKRNTVEKEYKLTQSNECKPIVVHLIQNGYMELKKINAKVVLSIDKKYSEDIITTEGLMRVGDANGNRIVNLNKGWLPSGESGTCEDVLYEGTMTFIVGDTIMLETEGIKVTSPSSMGGTEIYGGVTTRINGYSNEITIYCGIPQCKCGCHDK